MQLNLQDHTPQECYKVLASLVVPRPIAWVSTRGKDGVSNLAPYSFFNVLGVRPPIVGFAPGNKPDGSPKDTPQNILETGEFVVNLVDESVVKEMVESAAPHPAEVSEIQLTGLTEVEGEVVSAPRIAEAPVSLECKALDTMQIGGNRLVLGEVLYLHAREGLLNEKTLQLEGDYFPVGRMASPDHYVRTTDRFRLS